MCPTAPPFAEFFNRLIIVGPTYSHILCEDCYDIGLISQYKMKGTNNIIGLLLENHNLLSYLMLSLNHYDSNVFYTYHVIFLKPGNVFVLFISVCLSLFQFFCQLVGRSDGPSQ